MTSHAERDPLLDHDYDGIQELDNDLPRWWVWLFILCVIWGVLYMAWYHVAQIGYLSTDEYRSEMNPDFVRWDPSAGKQSATFGNYHSPWYDPQRDLLVKQNVKRKAAKWVEEKRENDTTTYVALMDADNLTVGGQTFTRLCIQCHGPQGQGGIGPNLTDNFWIHGAGITNVAKSIKYGYPDKGMISWRTELSPDEIVRVSSYVQSLHGTNPPNPKAPQGELVQPTQ